MERASRIGLQDVLCLVGILVLAALLRLPGLDERGAFDADQGHDMLVLAGILRGEIPLLGPPTSIGTFHHGAIYYFLLTPPVLAFGADPVAVMGWIALIGVGAVAATWWLARLVGGPVAAVVAGLLAALSPAGVEESIFIWNPNLIPLASALAFAAAIHAWQARSARWWLLAATGAMVTMQCHVLGIVVLPPLAAGWALDVRRSRGEGRPIGALAAVGVTGLAIIAASYLPLLVHELTTGWTEARAILDYVAGGGRGGGTGLLVAGPLVAIRALTWPLVGLITESPTLALVAGAAALALFVSAMRWAQHRGAARGLVATFVWSILALGVFAPGLAYVVEALPNDHYHAFLDPIVLALVGSGIAGAAAAIVHRSGRAAAVGTVAATLALSIVAVNAWPPSVATDGGWIAAERDAAAIRTATSDRPFALVGLPDIKSTDAVEFPLQRMGVAPLDADEVTAATPHTVVIVCDPVLESVIGLACGGPAEARWLAGRGLLGGTTTTLDGTGQRRTITMYEPAR